MQVDASCMKKNFSSWKLSSGKLCFQSYTDIYGEWADSKGTENNKQQ